MVEVYNNLFVGNQEDYENHKDNLKDWYVIHACKEPYHRRALGYTGRSAPKDSPFYLFLYIKNHLILNMVDCADPSFFSDNMINEAANFCISGLKNGKKVLIHCNQGESRAPSLAIVVLKKMNVINSCFEDAIKEFKEIYPNYKPSDGIYKYLLSKWNSF